MDKHNPLLDKSLAFAARIVKLYQYLVNEKKESIISKQIIRSGTSIGANANEAAYGVSVADYIEKAHGESILNDCLEIKKILTASLKTEKEDKNECHLFSHANTAPSGRVRFRGLVLLSREFFPRFIPYLNRFTFPAQSLRI